GRANFVAVAGGSGLENVFERLDAAIALLEDPAADPAAVGDAMRATVEVVDHTLGALERTRVGIGERLRAIDAHEQALESGSIQSQARLSELVDLDYARALSELAQRGLAIEAAMRSYGEVSRLTLFDYL